MLEHDSKNTSIVRGNTAARNTYENIHHESLAIASMLKFLMAGLDSTSLHSDNLDIASICVTGDGYNMVRAIIEKADSLSVYADHAKSSMEATEDESKRIQKLERENKKLRALLSTNQFEHTISGSIGAIFPDNKKKTVGGSL